MNTANASGKIWHIINNIVNVTISPIPFSNVSNLRIPIIYLCIAPIAIPKKQNGILYICIKCKIYATVPYTFDPYFSW